jgi:Dyp-type peroxidase family
MNARAGAPAVAPPPEPVLDGDDIQGDGLAGFRKSHQTFVFFTIADVAKFRPVLRALTAHIASLTEVGGFNRLYRHMRARRGVGATGLSALWVNIAFTRSGLAQLTTPDTVAQLPDEAFQLGLAARARGGLLGDLPPAGQTDATAAWHFGGTATPIDGMLTVACDDATRLTAATDELTSQLFGSGAAAKVWVETCQLREDLPGHEHFGFRDGISQPGVRGRLGAGDGPYVTARYLDPADPHALRYSSPGQRLIYPGEFVLGLPRQRLPPDDDLQPGPPSAATPDWAANGSFLVVRRLSQDVAAFRAFAQQAAAAVTAAGVTIDAERLAAMIVGRWPSGAPVVRSPQSDDAALGADNFAANDFGFVAAWGDGGDHGPPRLDPHATAPPGVAATDRYPAPTPDAAGLVCPHASHIRKVNPRDQETDQGGAENTLHRRIIRRGIPFGSPWTPATAAEDRGLMFVSYQASITDQFEFLTTNWVNRADAPRNDPGGVDVLIGGKPISTRQLVLAQADGPPITLSLQGLGATPWITATGGGYFFAPSLSALSSVLAPAG